MSHFEINHWIHQDEEYATILNVAGIDFDTICWADDLAIPWATHSASDLPKAVQCLLGFVKQTFARKGMSLNMTRGKTSVVAHFTGEGAKEERARLQLSQGGGEWMQLPSQEQVWLHYVPTYKHLGTVFCASLTLDYEVRTRIGMAYSAFQFISSPVLCNRRLPVEVRLKLFRALVLSKLFYGAGAWSPLPATTLKRLRTAIAKMLRRLLGGTSSSTTSWESTATIFARAQLLEPEAYIALERLRYAANLYKHGWTEMHSLLEKEDEALKDSWLAGLREAVQWYNGVMLPHDEIPTALPDLQAYWMHPTCNWKRQLVKLTRRHLHQERIIEHAMSYHRIFFKTLRDAGAQFTPDPNALTTRDQVFECACGRAFSSGQGLAVHRRKAHGIYSKERPFLQGSVCPSCMKMFWTTQRLQQHLAYIPRKLGYNRCYHALGTQGYQVDYEMTTFPRFVQGLQRIESIPVAGPCHNMPSLQERERISWTTELEELRAEEDLICLPIREGEAAEGLHSKWTTSTQQWFLDFVANGWDVCRAVLLPDLWVDTFVGFEDDYSTWASGHLLGLGGPRSTNGSTAMGGR